MAPKINVVYIYRLNVDQFCIKTQQVGLPNRSKSVIANTFIPAVKTCNISLFCTGITMILTRDIDTVLLPCLLQLYLSVIYSRQSLEKRLATKKSNRSLNLQGNKQNVENRKERNYERGSVLW